MSRRSTSHKSRELRRRVLLPARMRTSAGWSDACILNVSSRGALIHAKRPITQGSVVELRHGDHVIVGRVVWREGAKAGLQSEDRLPIEQILSLSSSAELRISGAPVRHGERRRRPRSHEQSRMRSRSVEFASVVIIAVALSSAAFALMDEAFAAPLARVSAALAVQDTSASSR
jgi:hypothetical protein